MNPLISVRSLQALVFAMLCGAQLTMASPTQNEFEECRTMATSALTHCIDDRGVTSSEVSQCWPESERVFNTCRGWIQKRHTPTSREEREAAERAKRAAAEMRRQQENEKPGQ